MNDFRQATIDTYNRSAKDLAEYFRGIGPRKKYINKAFKLAGNPKDAKIVEIGCGDGRDAKEIAERSSYYLGFDISEGLIKLARQHVPEADFQVADAVKFEYPNNVDIVFAFASLLHLDKEEVKQVCSKVYQALRPGGIFYISLKYAPEYQEMIKRDQYGTRMFYLYHPDFIQKLAGNGYKAVHELHEMRGKTPWFELALQKD